ncbi:right-handed parallel beta-helix repeat-containing protein [Dysgonomonas sp. Marseille-P4361]|uniref:right-handed parallel beta-helix repeat-containing protein n=1 Tax=Dysgonomonas sp. Marseille-P4361 TaxID=2161820 RepID=UPI000D55089F|nr:right-handed parallel beta-helix repeat-containing protein [Dysgonomonas sp. Marseille-P4361]
MNTFRNYLLCTFLLTSTLLSFGFSKGESTIKTIYLSSYGAIPNDDIDDSNAFRAALDECRKHPGTTLVIEPGDYNFKNEQALNFEYKAINGQYGENVQGHFFKPNGEYVIALDFDSFKDITIQAQGVTLIQEGWYEAVSITNAENVTINGLTLIHKRPPFTTGKIVNSTPDYFDMRIDTLKYPFLTDKITGRVHFHDVEKQRIYTGGRVEKKELIDRETIRLHTKTQPKVNDLCILRHSAHNRAGILIKESSNISIENVTIHSHPGMGIVGHRSENITMRNLQVVPAPGTVTSTNTDATHFTSCKGKILFDACKFGGQGDDCTNVHNYYWSVYKESGNTVRVTVENADLHALSLDYPDIGDTIALVSRDKLTPVEYYITKEVKTSKEKWEVLVTLDKPLKYNPEEYYMTNLTRRPAVEIVNNVVRSHMARAYLIKSRNVKIQGNVIQSSSGSAIQLGAEASWRESGPVENVLIENNWIIGCGYGHGRQKGSAISAEVNGVKVKSDQLNKNIIIRNNVIEAEGISAIYISGTDGVEITNNKISGSEEAILVENSKHVTIENNGKLPFRIND